MKQLLFAFLILLSISGLKAQAPADQRTTTTRIADLLARMPASSKEEFDRDMLEAAQLGQEGLVEMASMLSAPGKGDNTRLEFALGSYSYYTTRSGNEALKASAARAYATVLSKLTDKENMAFIIRQLQITGSDASVISLRPFLSDERLCDPSARALVKIHTESAGAALLEALGTSAGKTKETLVQALGDFRYSPAAPAIEKLAAGPESTLTRLSLYALGRIAAPSSEMVLTAAAQKSGFSFDKSGALTAFIDYTRQLSQGASKPQAEKLAKLLYKKTSGESAIIAHTAALKLLVEIQGDKSLPLLLSAVDNSHADYREAALKYALPLSGPAATEEWLKKLKSSEKNKPLKAAIITMLGRSRNREALGAVTAALTDGDDSVRLHAIAAAAMIGQAEALPVLLELLQKNNPKDINAVQKALLVMKGNGLTDKIGQALPLLPAAPKAAMIEVLAARSASSRIGDVLPLVKSTDPVVSSAAYAALRTMSTQSTLPSLYPLLLSAQATADIHALQDAIVAGSAEIRDTAQRTGLILAQMQAAPLEKRPLFYDILGGIGSKQALETVYGAFAGGDAAAKAAVVDALSKWPNASAATPLFAIAGQPGAEPYFEEAFKGYIHLISKSSYPDDQRLLMLRKAMDIAKTVPQQQAVLEEVQRCHTFIAMVFAGKYLDNPDLSAQAASAVMDIALSQHSWVAEGALVRSLLEKTITRLKGGDSQYQQQAIRKFLHDMPSGEGLVPLFNGKDLTGWKGLVENPIKRAQMDAATLQKAQEKADEDMRKSWSVRDGILEFSGNGENLCTVKKYGDFDMYVDWKIDPDGDAGIYLRGSPQVQIWDTSRRDVGAQVGSGGLYNNTVYESKPLVLADNAIGDWNSFHILMKGDRVTVYLNGVLVVDNIILENYWDRSLPIFAEEQIELQAHGRHVSYRDIYIDELPRTTPYALSDEEKNQGFQLLFDGTNMHQWTGNTTEYTIEDGAIAVHPIGGNHGNLYTKNEYQDFVYRFEFQLTPAANNGIGIRAPLEGDAAYVGMEIQVLDNEAEIYRNLHPYQYHGSVYGVIPAKRGFLRPTGEWNEEEITAVGTHIKVVLNGTTILDGDIADAIKNGTMDHKEHPGLANVKGHLGFLGHGDVVKFRHMRVKDLSPAPPVPADKKKTKKKK